MILKKCLTCNKEFNIPDSWEKIGRGKYCSQKCYNLRPKSKVLKKCLYCKKEFYARRTQVIKEQGNFCSRKCRAKSLSKKEIRICKQCGKFFEAHQSQIRIGKAQYCSISCRGKARIEKVTIICPTCNKEFKIYKSRLNLKGKKYCSRFCSVIGRPRITGSKNYFWKGGISKHPKYCYKFNNNLKEKVRDSFNRSCFVCGKIEVNKKLSIHHVDYNKSQGCKGQKWALIPLCQSCHSKTNANRWFWFLLLRDYWIYKYEGFEFWII